MGMEQALLQGNRRFKDMAHSRKDESTYKRDLAKRIELINWVLDNMKNHDIQICDLIESKMKELVEKVKQIDDVIEADPLHSEIRILDWILYQVCGNEIKRFLFALKNIC